jgi:hypothetical protein
MTLLYRLLIGLALLAAIGVALAQESAEAPQDVVQARYALALDNLRRSLASLPEDSAQSLEYLERAAVPLGPLAQGTTSTTLVSAMEATFERARTAVRNQSGTDLMVQVSVLAGGFRRLLYEAALREAAAGNMALAEERLSYLARDMGLGAETLGRLADAPSTQAMQSAFETGSVAAIRQRLDGVEAQLAGELDIGISYRLLAQAYGIFIPIQDSPRAPEDLNEVFVDAIQALVTLEAAEADEAPSDEAATAEADEGGEVTLAPREAFEAQLAALQTRLSQFAHASQQELGEVEAELPEDALEEEEEAAVAPDEAVTTTEPADTVPANEAEAVAPAPAEALVTEDEAPTPSEDEAVVVTVPEDTPSATEPVQADSRPTVPASPETAPPASEVATDQAALERGFVGFGLDSTTQARLVSSYQQAGLSSVGAALDQLYATSARALAASARGDQRQAQALVSSYRTNYSRLLEPLVSGRDAAFNRDTLAMLRNFERAPALRQSDLVALVERTRSTSLLLEGQHGGWESQAQAFIGSYWVGFPRLAAMIVLGLLAFVPLYLLNLAFGGGNRSWKWIGTALFLLLLPIIFEGLTYLGSLLAELTDIVALDALAAYSLWHSPLAQVAWTLLTALAIVLASVGLYGICAQFGLLGSRAKAASARASNDTRRDTVVEWDEDF